MECQLIPTVQLILCVCEYSVCQQQLETDETILLKKARSALVKYGSHAVVANELVSRQRKVILVTAGGEIGVEVDLPGFDVEEPLVQRLWEAHVKYCDEGEKR